MRIARKRKMSKKIVAAILVACLIVGSIVYVVYAQQNKSANKPRKPITYSGPSEQDKKDAKDKNSAAAKREQAESQTTTTSSSKKQVTPIITNASQSGDQITVNAYVSGIFEDGGTCTMTATKGSAIVTRTTKAFADATTTSCPPFFINRSAFSESGSWSVKISYSSAAAEGTSQASSLAIQ